MTHHISFLFMALATATIIPHSRAFGGCLPTPCRLTNGNRINHRRVPVSVSSKRNDSGGEYDPRDNLGLALRSLQSSAFKETMVPGDTVVCKREVPSLGIYENEGYELRSVYAQSFREDTQTIEKVPLADLDAPVPPGCDRYVTLYSPVHHGEPVVVTPEEVGLASVRSELLDAAWLAVPGIFWVFVASSIYNIYHERTGASFSDAFWGR